MIWSASIKNTRSAGANVRRAVDDDHVGIQAEGAGDLALGREHPNVATSLENYAARLRKTGRTAEADMMEARAKAIRDKRVKENK